MTFLYCIPGKDHNEVDVKACGLEYAFEDPPLRGLCRQGMDGRTSAVLADRSLNPARLKIKQDEQTWMELPEMWVGYWNDAVPTEESLRRKAQLTGVRLDLGRGEEWLVPQAVSFEQVDGSAFFRQLLSRYITVNKEGELEYGDVEERFAPLMNVVLAYYQFEDHNFADDAEYFRAAPLILGYNYRVAAAELALLKVMTRDTCSEIVATCADSANYVKIQTEIVEGKIQKKIADDASSMNSGETGEPSPTSQLQPIS